MVYGPNQDNNRVIPFVINNSLEEKKFNCSPGNQLRDFIYIDDVVEAIFKTLKSFSPFSGMFLLDSNTDLEILNR